MTDYHSIRVSTDRAIGTIVIDASGHGGASAHSHSEIGVGEPG